MNKSVMGLFLKLKTVMNCIKIDKICKIHVLPDKICHFLTKIYSQIKSLKFFYV